MARQEGLEPPAYCLEGSCSILLSYWRIYAAREIRTCGICPPRKACLSYHSSTRLSRAIIAPREFFLPSPGPGAAAPGGGLYGSAQALPLLKAAENAQHDHGGGRS